MPYHRRRSLSVEAALTFACVMTALGLTVIYVPAKTACLL